MTGRLKICLAALTAMIAIVGLGTNGALAYGSWGDWITYLENNARTGFNSAETTINQTTAANLKLHWVYQVNASPQTQSISTQPIVTNNIIYWGSWDGQEHATDLKGNLLWSTFIGQTTNPSPACIPNTVGVASSGTVRVNLVGTPVLYVGGGNADFYALNALTGAVLWHTVLGAANDFTWSSPAIYRGAIYLGVASFGDCPSTQGRVVQIDATTGLVLHTFNVVPAGCLGGDVWGSPAIDNATGYVYVATGNAATCSTSEPYAVALLKLRPTDLSVVSSWAVPASAQIEDSDFGTTPTLFPAVVGGVSRSMVGLQNKNGIYYAFDTTSIASGPLWTASTCNGCGAISPGAYDGSHLYVASGATTLNGATCTGSIGALDPSSGTYIWQDCLTSGYVFGAVSAVPGLAVIGAGPTIQVVRTDTGQVVFQYYDGSSNSTFFGAASISHGVLYAGNKDGKLFALGL